MKLRKKVLMILGVGLVGLSTSFAIASKLLLERSYVALEEQKIKQDVQRFADALSEQLDDVSRYTLDYSKWDNTYEFIVDKNKSYLENDLSSYIDALEMNAIVYVDDSANVVTSLGADLSTGKAAPVSSALLSQLTDSSPLLKHSQTNSKVQGIIQLPEGPMLVSSRPIVTSEGKGPIRGTLVMGRYLNTEALKELQDRTKLPNIALEKFNGTQLPPDFQSAKQALTQQRTVSVVQPLNGDSVAGYTVLKDLSGQPAFILQVTEPRDIYAQGQSSLTYLILATLLMGLAFSIIILLFLEKSILSRLGYLSARVSRIGTSGISADRVVLPGDDELTDLANTFNSTLDQLGRFQKSLQDNAERLQRQNSVLAELSHDESLLQGNVKQVARKFVEVTAAILGVERVSIWLYDSTQSQITCLDLYESTLDQHTEGMILRVEDYPSYFEALIRDGLIVVEDAQIDPKTIELADSYLIPKNIKSRLDFPIQIADRTVGVIFCEQVDKQRLWRPEEQTFIYSIANLVSLALESEALQNEVGHLLDVVSWVEEGNLAVEARVGDRITGLVADTLNRLINRLTEVLSQVLDAARQMSEGANQQKELAKIVASNAEQQAQEVIQVLNLIENVEHTAQDSADKTNASSESLRMLSRTVAQGQEAIVALTQGIRILQEGTDRIVQRMKTLGEFVGLADQFVQDQNQITFITQTLSLNASLVAARASEQRDPRQFVVVAREFDSIADQVSKLAEQTSGGLVTIEQRSAQIHSVVSAVDADVQSLGELVKRFTQGVEQSSQVFSNVQTVTDTAVQTGDAVTQFSQKIVESAQATAQVMREITELAAKTAELTQRSQERSDQIDLLSAQLLQSVRFFQLPSRSIPPSEERVDLSQAEAMTLEAQPEDPRELPLSPARSS
jgi:sensor domain CHASE-containing protein/GAF domain-containing protein